MLPLLAVQNGHGITVEGNGYRLPRLRFISVNPGRLMRKINFAPPKSNYIAVAKPRRHRKPCHLGLTIIGKLNRLRTSADVSIKYVHARILGAGSAPNTGSGILGGPAR